MRITTLSPLVLLAGAVAWAGCTEEPTELPLRSLQSSGPVAFVCLGAPTADSADFALALSSCTSSRADQLDDYAIPHLYALVTQTQQGEVAVVDLTTESDAVVDEDPTVPGANFLPVGALPTDIVATPGGAAAFVAVAEPAFEGIYALPATMLRGANPRVSSWPSCSLPAAPGTMLLAEDPLDEQGRMRPRCDADYGASESSPCEGGTPGCNGDLGADGLRAARPGRQKLIVALPSEGGFAVIDAQDVLDRPAGQWAACTIERWIPLDVTLSPPAEPEPPAEAGCVNEHRREGTTTVAAFTPRPGDMVANGGRLYIADGAAPVIHVIDMATPCEPYERPGLFPRSAEDPTRVVRTSGLALTPRTLDLRQYLYAIDEADGSVMVFDVSDTARSRTPIDHSAAELNPFQPPDRIRFQAPPRAVISLEHLGDEPDGTTGASVPVRCDPNPDSTGPGTVYRTSSGYDDGAGPSLLRGVFTFVVLATGDIVTIDVDDYDAPCRGPTLPHPTFGCDEAVTTELVTSAEYSCRTVVPHTPRAAGYLVEKTDIASNVPGVQTLPLVVDSDGAAMLPDDTTPEGRGVPRLRAPAIADPDQPPANYSLVVGSDVSALEPSTGELLDASGAIDPSAHTLAMNLEEPRAHLFDQAWTVTYEGALPGLDARYVTLTPGTDQASWRVDDASSRFCARGVMSLQAVEEQLLASGLPAASAHAEAVAIADVFQVASAFPVENDSYWESQGECSYAECRNEFGPPEQPLASRELRIMDAWQGSLQLEAVRSPSPDRPSLGCCFPGVVSFRVRATGQWLVVGESVGLLHHVVADPDNGQCRPSCDPLRARENGRARDVEPGTVLVDGDARLFVNPFFRFGIQRAQSCTTLDDCVDARAQRGTQFQFTVQGAFSPQSFRITSETDVQPQAIEYLTPTGELVVSDGSLEGIMLVDLGLLSVTRQYY